jgi:hypothetical protein
MIFILYPVDLWLSLLVPNCVQSRHIILHWKNCATPNCFLCGSLRKPSTARTPNPPSQLFDFADHVPRQTVFLAAKDWQQQIHQDHRSHLVKKITSALLETVQQDNHPLPPERVAPVTSYAQKTEADAYNNATSQEDYFQRLAERIYRIQKDYEEKQMLRRQQTSTTTTLTSIDRSAGELGPPNRIAPQTDFSLTQLKSEPLANHQSASASMLLDKQRISTEAVGNKNSNAHANTNGSHKDTIHIKTEEIVLNHDSKSHVSTTSIEATESTKFSRCPDFISRRRIIADMSSYSFLSSSDDHDCEKARRNHDGNHSQ